MSPWLSVLVWVVFVVTKVSPVSDVDEEDDSTELEVPSAGKEKEEEVKQKRFLHQDSVRRCIEEDRCGNWQK